jgi:hypothetical protein
MNRFQMLKKQAVANKPVAYSFKQTSSPAKVVEYIKRCLDDGVAFDASNIYSSVVDQALARLYPEWRIPIITKSEKMMQVLVMAHHMQKVYTVDNIPVKVLRAICYWDLNPKEFPSNVEVALSIRRNNGNK